MISFKYCLAAAISGLLIFGADLSLQIAPYPGGSLSSFVRSAQAAEEMPKDMLAAEIRFQGFACDKPLGATRDAKRSKPDHPVWILKCSNARYRVSRVPDMAAKVEALK